MPHSSERVTAASQLFKLGIWQVLLVLLLLQHPCKLHACAAQCRQQAWQGREQQQQQKRTGKLSRKKQHLS
jgi:hypothetical protein